MHTSHTSTDTLEKLLTALDVFRIHLKTAKDHLKLFYMSELVLKVENTFINRVECLIKIINTRINYQDYRDWLHTVKNKIGQIEEQDKIETIFYINKDLSKLHSSFYDSFSKEKPGHPMDLQTRLLVIASIRSYRSLCILLQEFSNRNLIHPIVLQQLADFLYANHYHDTVLQDFRSSETLLNPYIIEVQPPYPGRKSKLKLRKRSKEMPLATAIKSPPQL